MPGLFTGSAVFSMDCSSVVAMGTAVMGAPLVAYVIIVFLLMLHPLGLCTVKSLERKPWRTCYSSGVGTVGR